MYERYNDNFNNNNYNNNSLLFCNYNNGPSWGNNGQELCIVNGCLSNNNSISNKYVFNYKGMQIPFTGENNFQVEDYETYELILE